MNTDYRKARFDSRSRTLKEIQRAEKKSETRLFLKPILTTRKPVIERKELEKAKQEAKYMSDLELMKAREQAKKYLPKQ